MTMTAAYLPLGSKSQGKYGTCGVQRLFRGLSPKKTIDSQMMTYSAPFNKIDNSVSLFLLRSTLHRCCTVRNRSGTIPLPRQLHVMPAFRRPDWGNWKWRLVLDSFDDVTRQQSMATYNRILDEIVAKGVFYCPKFSSSWEIQNARPTFFSLTFSSNIFL